MQFSALLKSSDCPNIIFHKARSFKKSLNKYNQILSLFPLFSNFCLPTKSYNDPKKTYLWQMNNLLMKSNKKKESIQISD